LLTNVQIRLGILIENKIEIRLQVGKFFRMIFVGVVLLNAGGE
jgi:hypothetical protein